MLCQVNLFLVYSTISGFITKNTSILLILCCVSYKNWRGFGYSEVRKDWYREVFVHSLLVKDTFNLFALEVNCKIVLMSSVKGTLILAWKILELVTVPGIWLMGSKVGWLCPPKVNALVFYKEQALLGGDWVNSEIDVWKGNQTKCLFSSIGCEESQYIHNYISTV